uniref:Uncharacterized protein n=1 Tax=Trichobilharzia regenti TaxID=157069 RepID=A0AA85IYP5_TRIRE|nr:unnamed protein product [Trichobilharzia regenti]
MLSKGLSTITIPSIYRPLVLGVFMAFTVIGYQYLYPDETFRITNLLVLFKYITFITLTLVQVYFSVATLLQTYKVFTIHSYFYTLAFTYSWTIAMIYLIVYLVDPTVATDNPELKAMPLWFNHVTHFFPPAAVVVDAFVWRPKSVKLSLSFIVCYILMAGYNIYIEVSISAFHFSPYPKLDKIPTGYRFLVYVISWGLVSVFTACNYYLLRLINQQSSGAEQPIKDKK